MGDGFSLICEMVTGFVIIFGLIFAGYGGFPSGCVGCWCSMGGRASTWCMVG